MSQEIIDTTTRYFAHLAMSQDRAMQAHRDADLWSLTPEKTLEWGNVTEHCLLEAARVGVLADWLKLPTDLKADLVTAAAVHDVGKKREKEIVRDNGLTWSAFDEANRESQEMMKKAGLSERVIRLANGVGHTSLQEAQLILDKANLGPDDVAWLVMHYVDDVTINNKPAAPAVDGVNDLDRRMQANASNERYKVLDEEGRIRFGGKSTFDVQAEVGKKVESVLAKLAGIDDPSKLPELIDAEIIQRANK